MRINKIIKNITVTLLIMSFVVFPFLNSAPKAYAQTGSFGVNQFGVTGGVGGYMKLVGPLIPKLQGCGAMLKNKIHNISSAFSGTTVMATDQSAHPTGADNLVTSGSTEGVVNEGLADDTTKATQVATSIPVMNLSDLLIQQEQLTHIKHTEKTADEVAANKLCLDSVGKAMVKLIIRKLTQDIIVWINTGDFGDPLWPKNRPNYFTSLGKNITLAFNNEIAGLGPFSKAYIRNNAIAFRTKFAQNARFSFNQVMQDTNQPVTYDSFNNNFGSGGWGAWALLTQVPANNPFGFNLMTQSEWSKRMNGVQQSQAQDVRDGLQEAGGFLGTYRCTAPEELKNQTKQEYARKLASGNPFTPKLNACLSERNPYSLNDTTTDSSSMTITPYDAWVRDHIAKCDAISAQADDWNKHNLCAPDAWAYVTPGKMVAEAATGLMHHQQDSLLNVNDLNDAIAAILDSALNKFGGDLIDKGLAGMDKNSDYNQYDLTDAYSQDSSGQNNTNIPDGFDNVTWFQQHPNFDITKDLNQALIDEQRTYMNKLKDQNAELISDGTPGFYTGLIPTINQLDYCIPGPHPGWEDDSRQVLSSVEDKMAPETEDSLHNKTLNDVSEYTSSYAPLAAGAAGLVIGATWGTAAASWTGPGAIIGTVIGAIVGSIVAFVIQDVNDSNDTLKVHTYYAGQINVITGLRIPMPTYEKYVKNPKVAAVDSKQGAVSAVDETFNRYIQMVHAIYNDKDMPSYAQQGAAEYRKMSGYLEMKKENDASITAKQGIVDMLVKLKSQMEDLLAQTKLDPSDTNYIDPEGQDYKDKLQVIITTFANLASNLASGDDIANVNNLIKQMKDSEQYVAGSLLVACEKTERNGTDNNLPQDIKDTMKMTYYPPHLHDYPATGRTWGPGFLSAMTFNDDANSNEPNPPEHYHTDYVPGRDSASGKLPRLNIGDLFPAGKWGTYLGRPVKDNGGVWETIIGVY
ncbi:MAG: hypothetical protein V4439_02075 [Patescibacteria group bacterium]